MARNENPAAKAVAERAEAMRKQNEEFYAREAASRPTPTQNENDLAKVGALHPDDKEPDGSESEEDRVRRVMEARIPGNNPYDTREMSADTPRRGRPPKSE